ncbi:MAG TPA: hypothetical protein VGL81_02460 [Polyangiaceae bacterium]|jgi:hypothetical protein
MRSLAFPAALTAVLLAAPSARADEPDPAVGFALGAATILAGFIVGGTLVTTNQGNGPMAEAGWFAIEGGFSLAPLVSHAAVGEWARGAVFASLPTATTLGTIPVFAADGSGVVEHGTLPQQRVMWGLFTGGLAGSMAGVIDTVFSTGRALHVAPVLGVGSAGVVVGGAL